MSRESHTRHEHKQHEHLNPEQITLADDMNHDFNKRHKSLIMILAIVMIVLLPIMFAAATILRMVHW